MFVEVVFNIPVHKSFFYGVAEQHEGAIQIGQRVRAPFKQRMLIGVVIGTRHDAPPSITTKPIDSVVDAQPLYTDELLRLGEWMANYYYCSLGEALLTMIPSVRAKTRTEPAEEEAHQIVADDVQDAIADCTTKQLDYEKNSPTGTSNQSAKLPILNQAQKTALESINNSTQRFLYLYGITGSGKSELLLHIAQQYVENKQGVIFLLPEISLALQVARALSERYMLDYALLHSRMSRAERVAEWARIASGAVHLVVGVRSAVFAPLCNIGAIIIDEEQDGAYKSSFAPRYHARHVAMQRVAHHDARLLFASATPSLEAWHHIECGRITRVSLNERVGGASQPKIEVAPMQKERRIIGSILQDAIFKTVTEQKQVILLHNRRGYGRTLFCGNCSYTQQCPHCSVSMIYHQQSQKMICHYCATIEEKNTQCPDCNSLQIGFATFGTERVEAELKQMFPRFRIARIDTDTVRQRHSLNDILTAFTHRKIDILLGTQIVAKGLNFASVELVGIILAESSLTLPDFRAEEQTFMLLTQVAGRAGRFSDQGRVIIQTHRPENRVIQAVCNYSLFDYYAFELEQRKTLSFPPYTRIIRIVTRSVVEQHAEEMATALHRSLHAQTQRPAYIYGPIPCPIAKIAKQYRYQLMISDSSFAVTHRAVQDALVAFAGQKSARKTHGQVGAKRTKGYVEVDIDPLRLL